MKQCLPPSAPASLGVELLQAEVTGPLSLRRFLQGGPQAVQVVASVTVITEEELVLAGRQEHFVNTQAAKAAVMGMTGY